VCQFSLAKHSTDLSVIAADGVEVAEFNLGAQRAQHDCLHVRDGEAVRAQVTQHLTTIRESEGKRARKE